MRRTLMMLVMILGALACMDLAVAGLLGWAEDAGKLRKLTNYFDYGRSVPGKHAEWIANPDAERNLFKIAWRPEVLAESAELFKAEDPAAGPVIRAYSMSFTNRVVRAAAEQAGLPFDLHDGPGAPPNFTYALFLADRENRRPGDIVVFGILSRSVSAMAALSHQTSVFEQPSPYSYPVFLPEGESGLKRIEPVLQSWKQQEAFYADPAQGRDWYAQLAEVDAFYGLFTHGLPALDVSPFARLARRSLALGHIARVNRGIAVDRDYPWDEALRRMIAEFVRIAREDGQIPVVVINQTSDIGLFDVLEGVRPALEATGTAYAASSELFDVRDPEVYLRDGHFLPKYDEMQGAAFLRAIGR